MHLAIRNQFLAKKDSLSYSSFIRFYAIFGGLKFKFFVGMSLEQKEPENVDFSGSF